MHNKESADRRRITTVRFKELLNYYLVKSRVFAGHMGNLGSLKY